MASTGTAIVRGPGDGTELRIGPTSNLVRIGGADSGGSVGVIEIEVTPGFVGPPPHEHSGIDHVWYVLVGRVSVLIGGERMVLDAGSCAFVPRGVVHSFGNAGDEPARLLEVDSPRTLDAYFAELADRFPVGAPVDPAAVAEIQSRHDTRSSAS